MSEIVLYDAGGTPSPRRVRMCLLEKGLPFKIKWLNLALMDQKAPSYLKLNPMGLVPTLVHDGTIAKQKHRTAGPGARSSFVPSRPPRWTLGLRFLATHILERSVMCDLSLFSMT
jgi:hypothetical protein